MVSQSSSVANLLGVLEIGDDVYVGPGNERSGKVAFIGETQFATGEWIGVILSSAAGKNDGTVNGVSYFKCEPMHGIFSKRQNVRLIRSVDAKASESTATSPPDSVAGSAPPQTQYSNGHRSGVNAAANQSTSSGTPSTPITSTSPMSNLQIGERVCTTNGRIGILRYLGPTDFAAGHWAGIELDEPSGKNNGTVGERSYFTCKPNHGLFVVSNKVTPLNLTSLSGNLMSKRSQESLHSHCSNLSSVSRSYRAQYAGSGALIGSQSRMSSSASVTGTPSYRPSSKASISTGPTPKHKDSNSSSIAVLRQLVQEKEQHIKQLLEERDAERSDLAAVNVEREKVEIEARNQHQTIVQLNEQLANLTHTLEVLKTEHEQILLKLHYERKQVEDLQFRVEEENIDKATLESRSADDESRIFELEEALMAARAANDCISVEVKQLREEVASLQSRLAVAKVVPDQTRPATSLLDNLGDDGLLRTPDGDDSELLQLSPSPDKPRGDSLAVNSPVSHTSIQPGGAGPDTEQLQQEIDQLRQKLSEQEAATQAALKRQADVLEVVTRDKESEIGQLNSQLVTASKHLMASKDESESIKKQMGEAQAEMQKELDRLKQQITEEGRKHEEDLTVWKNRVKDLTSRLETDKTKWAQVSMQQTVSTRKLEERLRQAEKQLMDYQESLQTSAHLSVQKDIEQVPPEHQALLAQLHEQEVTLKSQLDDLAAVRAEQQRTLDAQRVSDDKLERLESSLTDLRDRLATADTREGELVHRLDEITASRDQLVAELSSLMTLMPSDGGGDGSPAASSVDLVSGVKKQVAQLHQMAYEAEAHRRALESRVHQVEEQKLCLQGELSQVQHSLAEATRVSDSWRTDAGDLETARERMAHLESEVSTAMDQLSAKSTQLTALQERLDRSLHEHARLERAHRDAVAMLEAEKLELLRRVEQATTASSKVTGSDALSSPDETNPESQVAFLNSIIVDLHKKNSELEQRVQCMLAVADIPPPPKKTSIAPRLWCDECLIFDSHDTEKCPSRPQSIPENGLVKVRPAKKASLTAPSLDRTYCEICGVFDTHQTEDCTDAQTF